ncbi:family 10 glycosylhydrolase [Acholeplasma hippikon]|uniref:Uncharacterized protein conserved in bacteria n=1 Tax=Acholeplasma hippikon TaxID=264636 RepID=A0A449BKF2_9MOLU|nr:family 10 glycosylhydrolase [Acholeplasma hippikon]VEU82817.1 Uncharacterized protein conserved in bacteria [Acholeplasma hippikon]
MIKKFSILITLALLAFSIGVPKTNATVVEEAEALLPTSITTEQNGEFRAAWVSHWISSLPSYTTEATFKSQATKILDVLSYYNYNAIIIHFRTHNNALYKSEINPKASWFANVNFNTFDPMAWLIEESHRRGFEFHAWFNPYRLSTSGGQISGSIPAANPQSNSANILTAGSNAILNPGIPAVREHIVATIEEVLENYNVDAIHFDDYFYINMGANGATSGATTILTEPDQQTFIQYGQGYNTNSATDKANWRREQVNKLIEMVSNSIKAYNAANGRYVQFGIAPTGIWKNGNGEVTYDQNGMPITTGSQTTGQTHYSSYLFADTVHWIKQGWLDYILPQSYWATDHPAGSYDKLMTWWNKVVKYLPVNLYSGIGLYMAENSSAYSWYNTTTQFSTQLNLIKSLENVDGHSIYSYNTMLSAYNGAGTAVTGNMNNAKNNYLNTKVPLAPLKSFEPVILPAVENISHSNGTLTFDTIPGAKFYYIYRSNSGLSYGNEQIVGVVGHKDIAQMTYQTGDNSSNYEYGVRALSQTNHLGLTYNSNVVAPSINLQGTLNGAEYTSAVTITLTSANPITYSLDGEPWQAYTAPIQVKKNGSHIIAFKATENGEDSQIVSRQFIINQVNNDVPLIKVNGTKVGNNYQVGAEVTITSNGAQIYYKYNHGSQSINEWTLYTGPFKLNDATLVNGNYVIYAKTIDENLAESNEIDLLVKVVDVPNDPILGVAGDGNDPYYTWLELTLDPKTSTTQYRINNGAWTVYNDPVEFRTPGTYKFEYRAGTNGNILVKQFTIVSPVSVPTIELEGSLDDFYYKSEVKVTLGAAEGEKIFYRIHNGSSWSNYTEYTEPFMIKNNGTYSIEFYSQNLALEQSEKESKIVRVDIPYNENNPYVIRNGQNVFYYNTNIPVELPTTYTEKTEEFRAVWVSTVSNIDIPQHRGEVAYKEEIDKIIKTLKDNNFNAMFFQVRPMNDAFYESEFAPWSRYLGGAEGINPGWDVLAYIIEQAHKNGIEFHAWMNPYRVSSSAGDKQTQLNALSSKNFAKLNPEYVMQDNNGYLILNPGEPSVRQYLYNIVDELMNKYDIDGIHFDDYFYSYNGTNNAEDQTQFQRFNPQGLSRDDWRRENVNELVKTIFEMVEEHNAEKNTFIKFGISPFGIWRNKSQDPLGSNSQGLSSYSAQYADTYKWVKEGWVHYIMPQLYWEFNHSTARFADLVDWWVDVVKDTNVDLIIGHGFYRYAETSNNWKDQNELLEQLRYISQYEEIVGSSFFSYKTLNSQHTFVTQAISRLNNYFWTERPDLPWQTKVEAPIDPVDPVDPTDPVDPEKPREESTLGIIIAGTVSGVLVLVVISLIVSIKKKK